jgi:hypothetical protein
MKKIIRALVKNSITWGILNFFYKIFYRFKFEKDLIKIEEDNLVFKNKEDKLKKRFSDLIVKNGMFKGMKYPEFVAHGSSMFSKLLGSYESELYPEFEILLKHEYSEIIDVGCAEGYYAVGMALRKANAKIYAYDINPQALKASKRMAAENKVTDNIVFGNFCSPEVLSKFNFTKRGLVICDCEGYEIELFTKEVVNNLKNCDIVIELHDLYNEKITPTIENVFKSTHNVKLVSSENTFKRLDSTNLRADLTDDDVLTFFVERNGIMQWAIITPK